MRMALKILYLVLIWGLITAMSAGGSYVLNQQDMQPGFKFAGILFGIWVTWKTLRWLFIRYKARARAMQLANISESEMGESQTFWQKVSASWTKPGVDQRMVAALDFLSRSELSANQNPIYALPWFLALGGEKSGLLETLESSNAGRPSSNQDEFNSADFDTRWWMFNEGVVLSTSSSLLTSAPKMDEWLRVLQLLRKKRPANPLNGTIISISFAELEECSVDELRLKGQNYRKRLDEAMNQTGIRMPAYLMLTGVESLPGMSDLIDGLNDAERNQFFGLLNREALPAEEFVDVFVTHISETVQQRSLPLLLKSNPEQNLIQLPSAIRSHTNALRAFVEGCFQESAFQTGPDFQGVALTGQTVSSDGYKKPAFIKSFIENILSAENRIAGILPDAAQRRQQFRNTAFIGYLAFLSITASLLGYSYYSHKTFINQLQSEYSGTLVEREDLYLNIPIFYRMQTAIDTIDNRVWFPWVSNPKYASNLQLDFVSRSDDALFKRLETGFQSKAWEELLVGQDVKLMSQYVNTLVDQINWLELYSTGVKDEELAALSPPFTLQYPGLPDYIDQSQLDELNRVYRRYLDWNPDTEKIIIDLDSKRKMLEQILLQFPGQFSWIIEWANKLAYSDRIQLKNYWRGGATLVKKHEIPGAYTVTGKAAIDALLESMSVIGQQNSSDDNSVFLKELEYFKETYRATYLKLWEQFLLNFGDGAQVLANQDDMQGFIENMRTAKNPFFLMLTDANNQLIDFVGTDDEPDWLYLIDYYNQVLALLGQSAPGGGVNNKAAAKTATKLLGKLGKGGKALAKIAKTVQKTQKKMAKGGGSGPSPSEMELAMAEVSEFVVIYQQSIADIVANSNKRLVSLAAMQENFLSPTDPGGGTTSYAQAWKSINDIETLLGTEKNASAPFWRLFKGPAIAAQRYLMQEATCAVQEQWEEQYIAELDGIPQANVPETAFIEEGLLWAFNDALLKPFVKKGSGVFSAKKLDGEPLPLKPALFTYLNGGLSYKLNNQPNYQVFIEAKPIAVNAEATVLPHESTLTLMCPEQEYILRNNNFQVSEMMQWSSACQNFELKIAVGRYVIHKKYSGPLGFSRFIREFQYGNKRIPISEFPAYEGRLSKMGIKYFNLGFRFQQHFPLLNRLALSELKAPPIIADCWDLTSTQLAMEF